MRIKINGRTILKCDQRFKKHIWQDGDFKDKRIRRHRKPIMPMFKRTIKRVIVLALVLGFVGLHTQQKPETPTTEPVKAENTAEAATEPPLAIETPQPAQGDIFQVYFGDKADEARLVANCESGMDAGAISKTQDFGIMQIHFPTWGKVFGVTREQLLDADLNVRLAKAIFDRSGTWEAWKSSFRCHSLK